MAVDKEKLRDATNYARKYARQFGPDIVRRTLIAEGYSAAVADQAIATAQREHHWGWLIIGITLAIVLVVALLFFLAPELGTHDCGFVESCFIAPATACQNAVVRKDLQGTVLRFESFEDCTLTKRIEVFGPADPEEVRALFANKIMKCDYADTGFTPEFLELAGGLDLCEGDLKETIIHVQLARP